MSRKSKNYNGKSGGAGFLITLGAILLLSNGGPATDPVKKAMGVEWTEDFFRTVLFGCGPDTFYSAVAPYFSELQRLFGDASANCAHNELLNYLITTGIFGLSAYLALISSAVLRGVKRAEKSPEVLIFTLPIICCFCQSLVNIATPITTPLLFIFIALAENSARKT